MSQRVGSASGFCSAMQERGRYRLARLLDFGSRLRTPLSARTHETEPPSELVWLNLLIRLLSALMLALSGLSTRAGTVSCARHLDERDRYNCEEAHRQRV